MSEPTTATLIATLDDGRKQFLALVDDIRPDLHRYCARMTGSAADGEDVVQDTLARAYFQLSEFAEAPALRPWLFRIAHNRAIDQLRRQAYRSSEPLEVAMDVADDSAAQPDNALARSQAVRAAVASFLSLAPAQRACVILKDVLDHSLEDIAALLELSVPAVKSALNRGRAALRKQAQAAPARRAEKSHSPSAVRYASLFNAHDWDAIRVLLADDVRLELVARRRIDGSGRVGLYFTNYERLPGWHMAPGWVDDREVLVIRSDSGDGSPAYFVELAWVDGKIRTIRDFRFVPYIMQDAPTPV